MKRIIDGHPSLLDDDESGFSVVEVDVAGIAAGGGRPSPERPHSKAWVDVVGTYGVSAAELQTMDRHPSGVGAPASIDSGAPLDVRALVEDTKRKHNLK